MLILKHSSGKEDNAKIVNAKKSIEKVLENFWISLNSNLNNSMDFENNSLNEVKISPKMLKVIMTGKLNQIQ